MLLSIIFAGMNLSFRLRITLITILLFGAGLEVSGQFESHGSKEGYHYGYDTGYVVSFRDDFVITLVNETKSNGLLLGLQTPNYYYQLDYQTNLMNTWGIGIDYKWITFEFTKQMPWYTPDPAKGEVSNSGFGFGLTGRRWAFRNFIESSKGYYLVNTDDWLKDYTVNNSSYYQRPDISTTTYFASMNYFFRNKRFSNIASLWQLERQQKRAGSFVLGGSYVFNAFRADSSLVPTTGIDTFPRSYNTYFSLKSLGVNFGWAGTLPLFKSKKFFLTTALIPGISYQWGQVTIGDGIVGSSKNMVGLMSEFRFGFGYNGDKWYVGSVAKTYRNLNSSFSEEPFEIYNVFGRLYFGYRFGIPENRPAWLKKYGL